LPGEQTEQTMPATAPTTAGAASAAPTASSQPTTVVVATQPVNAVAGILPVPATQPSQATLGSERDKDQNYVLALHTSSRGASINGVTLNQFRQTVDGKELYHFQQPYDDSSSTMALATRIVSVNDTAIA